MYSSLTASAPATGTRAHQKTSGCRVRFEKCNGTVLQFLVCCHLRAGTPGNSAQHSCARGILCAASGLAPCTVTPTVGASCFCRNFWKHNPLCRYWVHAFPMRCSSGCGACASVCACHHASKEGATCCCDASRWHIRAATVERLNTPGARQMPAVA